MGERHKTAGRIGSHTIDTKERSVRIELVSALGRGDGVADEQRREEPRDRQREACGVFGDS